MPASRAFTEDERTAHLMQRGYEATRAVEAAELVAHRVRAQWTGDRVPPFAHLTARSSYSLRDGAIRPGELAAAAAAAGMTHVALTDRDGLYGAVRFAQAAADAGIAPVLGADLALESDGERPGWRTTRGGRVREAGRPGPGEGPAWLEDDAPRVTLIAADRTGYGDLCRTVSLAHGVAMAGMHDAAQRRGAPRLPAAALGRAATHDGVYALLGADSPVGRLVAAGRVDAAGEELARMLEVFGRQRLLLGVRHHLARDDDARVRRTLALAERFGVIPVAVNDVRYLTRDDAAVADVLACVRQQVPLGRRHLGRTTAEAFLATPLEMAERFRERPDLLANAAGVAASCEVDLGLGDLHVPRLTGLPDAAAAGELHQRAWSGVADRFSRLTPAVRERLERELAMVDRLGLHDYFLAVADIVAGVREEGILVACRGSAAGSLVCYALRISDVDPVGADLAFERFMNPYRDELPDIDIDVESARREDVYDLVMERYGEHRTACVAMVETFQARMAIREVGKVLGLPPDEIDHVAKSFTHARARDVRRAMGRLPELWGSRLDAGQLERLFTIVERIDGFPRHLALHPCGILLADTHLTERTPLERSAPRGAGRGGRRGPARPDGYVMSQFDKDDVAALGLLKLDVLGVRMLSAMRHTLDLVNAAPLPPTMPTPQPGPGRPLEQGGMDRDAEGRLDVQAIPDGDPATYALIRSTHSIGIFQIESPGQRELLARLGPEGFGDLITEISLFRPGPVKADMVTPFVARRNDVRQGAPRSDWYVHPSLEPVLAETYGVVVYHEQVMGALAALTGCEMSYADLLRRQLADDHRLSSMRAWALARAVERGFTREAAEAIWQQVASFASFGFCKAHAAAFAVPTYRSAYLKAHYLPEFMAGLLTHDPGMYPRRLILDECRQFGVAVLPPDVNRSEDVYTVEVVDQGLADHLLGLRGERLPPGWRSQGSSSPGSGAGGTEPRDRVPGGRGGVGGEHARRSSNRPVPPSGMDAGDAGGGYRYAVRVGLADLAGVSSGELDTLRAGRPYTSLADVHERGGLSRTSAEVMARAGAFDQVVGLGRRAGPSSRREVRLLAEELWARTRRTGSGRPAPHARQAALDLNADHRPELPAPTQAELVREELAVSGMDVSRHVASFYTPLLDALGVVRACDLPGVEDGRTVRVAGVKVAVQSPAQRSGQRVLFLSLDDATGTTQITCFERALPDVAWTVLHAWLMVAEGRVSRRHTQQPTTGGEHARRRSNSRGATVTGTRVWDLSRLWRAWQEGWLDAALAERGTPAPHERSRGRAAGLRASEFGRGSR